MEPSYTPGTVVLLFGAPFGATRESRELHRNDSWYKEIMDVFAIHGIRYGSRSDGWDHHYIVEDVYHRTKGVFELPWSYVEERFQVADFRWPVKC